MEYNPTINWFENCLKEDVSLAFNPYKIHLMEA
jgi:hypothetical protein